MRYSELILDALLPARADGGFREGSRKLFRPESGEVLGERGRSYMPWPLLKS